MIAKRAFFILVAWIVRNRKVDFSPIIVHYLIELIYYRFWLRDNENG